MASNEARRGCFSLISNLFGPRGTLRYVEAAEDVLPYRLRDNFLSAAEMSFYHVLNSTVQGEAVICPKVRLIDILYISRRQENYSYFGKISQKHIDFLLCSPNSMKPLLAIELDDRSHQQPDRAERDEFIDEAFETAGLPLIHMPVRNAYNTSEVESLVVPYLRHTPVKVPVSAATSSDEAPMCPRCGAPMVRRTAARGKNAGEQFWGCTNYPECRQIVPIG